MGKVALFRSLAGYLKSRILVWDRDGALTAFDLRNGQPQTHRVGNLFRA